MILIKKIEQYDKNAVYFSEPIKNKIINDSTFIRITYANAMLSLNGIYILIMLHNTISENDCRKYKYNFNFCTSVNKIYINDISLIEKDLLTKVEIPNKTPKYNITEQLNKGYIKKCNDIDNNYLSNVVLKISGIWETPAEYGLTYKFLFF